jgi:hypothetical protein
MQARVVIARGGVETINFDRLRGTDVRDLPGYSGEWTADDLGKLLVELNLHLHEDFAPGNELVALAWGMQSRRPAADFGGEPEDYFELCGAGPVHRALPHLAAARAQGHPAPSKYAMEQIGITARGPTWPTVARTPRAAAWLPREDAGLADRAGGPRLAAEYHAFRPVYDAWRARRRGGAQPPEVSAS